jgi:hypothetical protein
MKTLIATLAALLAMAGLPASAATFLTESAPAADGSITWDFGNTGGIPAGAFDDVFDILFPGDGLGAGSVTATFTSKAVELTFTAVSLGGDAFTLFDLPGVHGGALAPTLFLGGHHSLDVAGISPGLAGDYSGTLSFTPASVPEPTAWALMIAGFGMAGAALRARRRARET